MLSIANALSREHALLHGPFRVYPCADILPKGQNQGGLMPQALGSYLPESPQAS
jgi:hypothetical protein